MSKHMDFQKRCWDDYLYWQATDKKENFQVGGVAESMKKID